MRDKIRASFRRDNVGSILNAYREGDVSFDEACNLLEVRSRELSLPIKAQFANMRGKVVDVQIIVEENKVTGSFICEKLDLIRDDIGRIFYQLRIQLLSTGPIKFVNHRDVQDVTSDPF